MVSVKRKIGDLGERGTCIHLRKRGFTIIKRNYLRKWGEIDIIAAQDREFYFIEVKTIRIIPGLKSNWDTYRPEENMSNLKRRKLRRTIEMYLIEHNLRQIPWKFILASVYIKEGIDSTFEISLLEEVL